MYWDILELKKPLTKENEMELFMTYRGDRYVLILQKNVIVLSEHLKAIEDKLHAHPGINDVYLAAPQHVLIDCHLSNDKWHGINILVVGSIIEIVTQELRWDISGRNGKNASEERAPSGCSDSDPDGKDGDDGSVGNSGGNCIFIGESFLNMSRLTVKMNGGNGGCGQNAGHGKNGSDGSNGAEWTLHTLMMEFPASAKFRDLTLKNLDKHVIRYEQDCANSENNWGIWYKKGYFSNEMCVEWSQYHMIPITETYCLVRGAPGTAGQAGGFGGNKGFGGKGGYGGVLLVYQVVGENVGMLKLIKDSGVHCETWDGENGVDGKDGDHGMDGKPGQNGKDVGYSDSTCWSTPVTYGPSTLMVQNYCITHFDEQSDRIWCGYDKKYKTIRQASLDPVPKVLNTRKITGKDVKKRANVIRNQPMNQHLVLREVQWIVGKNNHIQTEFEKQIWQYYLMDSNRMDRLQKFCNSELQQTLLDMKKVGKITENQYSVQLDILRRGELNALKMLTHNAYQNFKSIYLQSRSQDQTMEMTASCNATISSPSQESIPPVESKEDIMETFWNVVRKELLLENAYRAMNHPTGSHNAIRYNKIFTGGKFFVDHTFSDWEIVNASMSGRKSIKNKYKNKFNQEKVDTISQVLCWLMENPSDKTVDAFLEHQKTTNSIGLEGEEYNHYKNAVLCTYACRIRSEKLKALQGKSLPQKRPLPH